MPVHAGHAQGGIAAIRSGQPSRAGSWREIGNPGFSNGPDLCDSEPCEESRSENESRASERTKLLPPPFRHLLLGYRRQRNRDAQTWRAMLEFAATVDRFPPARAPPCRPVTRLARSGNLQAGIRGPKRKSRGLESQAEVEGLSGPSHGAASGSPRRSESGLAP